MRSLALDIGDKTIGIAASDLLNITAQGVKTIRRTSDKEDLRQLGEIINQYDAKILVIGYPKNMNGTEGERCEIVKKFVSSYVIHSLKEEIFKFLQISDEIKNDIIRQDLFVKPGEKVYRFENGRLGIGAMLIKHNSIEEMNYRMDNMKKFLMCNVED